ncbi:MAG: glycosyltransferase family 2 protein [Phycisphaerales bacterium]
MSTPRCSVVLIVFNGEQFLSEAIESVLSQTIEDWELLVVDDGSADGSRSIAESFAAVDSRVRVIAHPGGANRGMSATRNLGLREARGEWVALLDHDDRFEPMKLEVMLELLEAHPAAAAAIGPNLRWHSWREAAPEPDTVQSLGDGASGLLDPPGLLPSFLVRAAATPLGPVVRRRVALAIGGFEESFRGMYEDQVFLARLMLRQPIVVSDAVLHRYRQHESSCVMATRRSGRDLAARRRFLDQLDAELDAASVPASDPLRAVVANERRATRGWWLRMLRRSAINVAGALRGEGRTG